MGLCAEVGGKRLGAVFGFMNGLGALGAMASQVLFGLYREMQQRQGYEGREAVDPAFGVYAVVLLVAALAWVSLDHRAVRRGQARGVTGFAFAFPGQLA